MNKKQILHLLQCLNEIDLEKNDKETIQYAIWYLTNEIKNEIEKGDNNETANN